MIAAATKLPDWKVVVNPFDAHQGSGFLGGMGDTETLDALDEDQVGRMQTIVPQNSTRKDIMMYGMLSSLEMQMHGKVL
jgi:hypothetical protein